MSRALSTLMLLALTGAVNASPAPAQNAPKAQLKVVELAIEAVAGSVLWPSGTVGNLVVTPCDKCAPVSLLATSSTQYFLGRSQVSMADLRQAIAGQPDAEVIVFYDAKTHELTRVKAAHGGGPSTTHSAGPSSSAPPGTASGANGSGKR